MNIILERFRGQAKKTGGGYASQDITIHIDAGLPLNEQRERLIHEILEILLPFLHHDTIDEFTTQIYDALEQLEEPE